MAPEPSDDLTLRAQRLSPDLYEAVATGPVSFDHIVQARRIRQLRRQYRDESRLLEHLAKARYAEEQADPIVRAYWCQNAYGGCAITANGRLLSVLNTYVADLVVLESMIKQLGRDAKRVFCDTKDADQLSEIGETLYAVMSRVMGTADVCHDSDSSASGREEAMAAVRHEWTLAQRRVASLIQREARFVYFVGVLWGAVLGLTVFGVLGWVAAELWPDQVAAPAFLAATLSGTVGAVVSVTQRMASGDLLLDYTASWWQKVLLGAARPVLGGIFAAAVHFALLGGLLTMQGGGNDTQNTPVTFAFFSLAGFAAGFSERLATDLLERAGAALDSSTDAQPMPPPLAAAATAMAASAPLPEVGTGSDHSPTVDRDSPATTAASGSIAVS